MRQAIHLGCLSPSTSSDLPGNDADHIAFHYLVLLQVGFTLPLMLPSMRCALTDTFSPLPLGGIFSVALSVGSRPPGVTWHLVL